jgi:hypothetical protein
MTTPQYRASVRKLNSLERADKLSNDGKRWLIQTVDPFHDEDQAPCGMPDTYMARNVVQMIKKTMVITKATTMGAGNWDCNIFNLPWVDDQPVRGYTAYKNVLYGGSGAGNAAASSVGGIVACQSLTSGDAFSFTPVSSAISSYSSLKCDSDFLDGPCRVVSCGFEVVNTTAEINKQGSVTVYRVPEPQQERSTFTIASNAASPYTTTAAIFSGEKRSRPPLSLQEASYMVGTRTWAAAEGCYIPLTLAGIENPVRGTDSSTIVMALNAEVTTPTPDQPNVGQYCLVTGSTDPVLSSTIPSARKLVSTPFNMGGAYFSGLSEETSLQLTVIFYVERFPTTLQRQLAVLAEPPPLYDPLALELYTLMMKNMPVGVMVKENGLGDWFADVVGSVAPFIEGALGAIPHPYAQMGAQAARVAGKMADRYRVAPGEKGDAVRAQLKKQRKKAKKAGKGAGKTFKAKQPSQQ